MKLDVLFRSCSRVYSVHGNRRLINCSKSEMIQRCLKSLIRSMNLAGGPRSTELSLTIIDDHSDPETVSGMRELLRTCSFPCHFFSLEETGNGASLRFTYEHAKEHCHDLIYFVEDDYLHSPEAIADLLSSYQHLSFLASQELVLFPCDNPKDYLKLKPSVFTVTDSRHWRRVFATTATIFTKQKILIEHWERFMKLCDYIPGGEVCEDSTINLIYETVPCLAPMPALAMHIVDGTEVPPLVRWTDWWQQSDPRFHSGGLNNPVVILPQPVADQGEGGVVFSLVNETIKSAGLVRSPKGSVGGNCYHRRNWHYRYILKGGLEYYYRPAGSHEKPVYCKITQGQMFYTPPLVEYAMVFAEDCELLCLSRNARDPAGDNSSDLIRVQVCPETIDVTTRSS